MLRLAAAAAALLAATGTASAEPMTVTDGAGTAYQLNEDGTYAIVVTGEDGRTYQLSPDGRWSVTDEAEEAAPPEDLLAQFDAFLEKAFAEPGAPKLVEGEWPTYKACLMDAFAKLPVGAQRMILASPGPREAFKLLQEQDPASAKALEAADNVCRKMVKFQ